MTRLPVEIPEDDGVRFRRVAVDADLRDALSNLSSAGAGKREPCDIAFDVGHEDGHAHPRKPFGNHHERHGLAGAGGAGDQTVTIAILRVEIDRALALAKKDAAR